MPLTPQYTPTPWPELEMGLRLGVDVTLRPAQIEALLVWRTALIEDKNAAVRENHALRQQIPRPSVGLPLERPSPANPEPPCP